MQTKIRSFDHWLNLMIKYQLYARKQIHHDGQSRQGPLPLGNLHSRGEAGIIQIIMQTWTENQWCNENVCRKIQYGAWLVMFREGIAEEVTSETVKSK